MFEIKGKILFDPRNVTNKHLSQSSWKRTAMVMFECDIDHYHCWFIRRRYNIVLNSPLRGPHVSFINDKYEGEEKVWETVKNKWNGMEVTISLNMDVRSDGKHWWLIVTEESRKILHDIRREIGLTERPHFGLHLSLGYANEKNIDHSNYIVECIRKGFI